MIEATPFVLPELPSPDEGGPAVSYHYRPGEDQGREITEWLEEEMALERPPRHDSMPVSSVVEFQLKTFFHGLDIKQRLHFDLTEKAEILGNLHTPEALMPDTPFTCYLNSFNPLVLHAYDLRCEIVEAESEIFASALFYRVFHAMNPITLTWGPQTTWEHLNERYYFGEGEEYMLDEHRHTLAQERGVDPDEITYDELREFCDGFFIMKHQVAEELPKEYSNWSFDFELPESHENEKIDRLLKLIPVLKEKGKALNAEFGPKGNIWEASDHFHLPWTFVLNVEENGFHNSYTRELFEDDMRFHLENCDYPYPELMLGVDPSDENSLLALRSMLRQLRDVHEVTRKVLEILDPINFPPKQERADTAGPAPDELLKESVELRSAAPLPDMFLADTEQPQLNEDCHKASRHISKLDASGRSVDTYPAEALAAFA